MKEEDGSKSITVSDSDKVANRLDNKVVSFIQLATGLAVSDKKTLLLDFSDLLQQATRGHLLEGLYSGYSRLKDRGSIKDDYLGTDQCRQEFHYIFDALKGDGVIDEKQFAAIKNIFLNSAQEKLSDRDSPLPVELMRICGTLNSGELILLEAAYRLNRETTNSGQGVKYSQSHGAMWTDLMAKKTPFGIPDMVDHYEKSLIDKGLFTKRSQGGSVIIDANYHLSGMGLKLCAFITDYELKDEAAN